MWYILSEKQAFDEIVFKLNAVVVQGYIFRKYRWEQYRFCKSQAPLYVKLFSGMVIVSDWFLKFITKIPLLSLFMFGFFPCFTHNGVFHVL